MRLVVDLAAARQAIGEKLAPREWYVFLETVRGKSQPEMAKERGIRPNAISMAKRRVMFKLNLWSDVELGMYAALHGIVKHDLNHTDDPEIRVE